MKNYFHYIILLCSISVAQQLVVKTNGEINKIPVSTSEIVVSSADNKIVLSESQNERLRLIVELKGQSRIEQRISGKYFSKSVANRVQQQILSTISGAIVEREFEMVINGFIITTERRNIRTITSMPDVKSVSFDIAVNTLPQSLSSSTLIVPNNTTTVATGKGIRIGIIDTGIDYQHEAFGGGIGKGYTVAGGYDFVNNDTDPMDDNGHGTHVAGIISGHSSTINGIAKDAMLFAYKVLDQNGSGTSSAVIAAIERAISDSVQVINLSLGTPSGSSDDPISTAVNRAVRAGIVVVVAAGNSGDYSTINSPGVAELALTVGATDANSIASFSSKGPETEKYLIKPDIVAPGVSILSAKKGGGYIQMSGTSMAAPFVTAIVAAMKELHPNWDAIQLKDAIISNSIDIGKSLFSQGHGKINDNVLLNTVFSSPAQISFGFNPPVASSWNQKRTITLYNNTGEIKNYRFVSLSTNPAIQFRFTPEQVEINSQGSFAIEIELETNNLFLSNNNSFENGYSGKLLAVSSVDTLSIPFTFIKAPVLRLHFDEIPWLVMIHNRLNFSKTFSPKINTFSLIVKDEPYDVISVFYGSRYVITEGINVNEKNEVDVTSLDAKLPLSFQPINEKGEQLDLSVLNGTYSYLEALVHQPTGFVIVGMGGGKTNAYCNRQKFFSNVSKNYSYGYSMTLQPNNKRSFTYDIIADSGIDAPRSFAFQAKDIKHIDIKYSLAPNVQRAFPITWTSFIGKFSSVAVTYYDGTSSPMTFPFKQETFYTERSKQFPIFHQREAYNY